VPGSAVVSVCGSDVADPAIKTAATRKMQRSQLNLKGEPPASTFARVEGRFLELTGQLLQCDPSLFLDG
jgi:hypothetical protein